MSSNGLVRKAYQLTLSANSLPDYIYWHENIWPELVERISSEGIARVALFENHPTVFLYSEISDEESWERLWKSEVHARWAVEVMQPLMEYRDDGIVDAIPLKEIWYWESSP